MNLFNVHKSIYAISEPFNIGNRNNLLEMGYEGICDYEVSDFRELDTEISKIFFEFNLVKHVWAPSGFPFVEEHPGYAFNSLVSKNEYLCTKFDYVIFLNRRNILKRLVSSFMSMQTGIWDSYQTNTGNRPENFKFEPLDSEQIGWHLNHERFYVEYFKSILINKKIEFVEVFQEDLFNRNLHTSEKIELFLKLTDFLKLPRNYCHDQLTTIRDYFNSKKHQQNSLDSYNKVPNINEIEETFGSDETGWLFKKEEAIKQ